MNEKTTGGTPTPQTKEERKNELLGKLEKLVRDNCEVEINLDDLDGIHDADDLYTEHAERAINEQTDVIYYSRAIEFLSENDPSLNESLALASELWYSLDDLNSEKLATLLNRQQTQDAYWTIRDKIDEIIDERHEIDDEEEEDE